MRSKDIKQFIQYDLWRKTSDELREGKRAKRIGVGALKTIILVARGFSSKQLNMTANALTYNLVFAIIPILAMVLAIAKGFGFAEVIETHLQSSMLGETNLVPTIMEMVNRYLDTAQGGAFIGIGILILIWAVYSFFRNVEQAFNTIWDVKQSRSIVRQMTTYIAVLFIIPVLIIVTSGLSIMVHATVSSLPWLSSMQQSGNINLYKSAVGCTGLAYLAIPGARKGEGKVQITINGAVREYGAITDGPDLPTGARIRVVEVIDPHTLLVEEINSLIV